ncbi:MAG: transcription termination/antitermination protein NusG [Terriglobales bacterium]
MLTLEIARSESDLPVVFQSAGENDIHWFAVYTASRHEKRVAKHFAEREISSFLPLYLKVHHWKKRNRVNLELPLFPNYIFVQISPPQRSTVLGVPGVLALVGSRHAPSALPEAEIESLRAGMALNKLAPHSYLVEGERVRIRAGSMEGLEGILVRKKNELRVVLTLDLIQRSVAVEVDAEDVEPATQRRFQPLPVSPNFN